MQYPNDRDLLTPPLSLSQFVNIAHQLGTRPDGANEHVQFVMAGRQNQRGTQYIVRVNPLLDEPDIDPDDFTFVRDYDSIIGFSDNLPFRVPLGIFPVPPFNETLKKESHITGLAYDGQGEQIMVPLHKVPNFALGKVAQRSVTRVFFPRKYVQDAQATITQNEFEVIYDECLRPAIEELLPESTARWPISYRAALELYRCRNDGELGRLAVAMVELPWMILDQFSGSFLQRLADQNVVFRDAYFVHEVRGVKGASIHRLDDLPGAQSALDEMLDHLDLHAINDENWFIDVGLEIGRPDHVVTWFADGHELLLQNVLNRSSHQAVGKLMKSKKFKTDHMALLKDCAGFRAETTARIRDSDHVNYICAYCTEKNVHYQRHPGLYRYRRADELQIPEKHKKIIDDLNTMSETLAECSGTQGTLQTGSARLEVRVPLRQAITANRFFDERLLELTVVSIPAKTWWTFKYYRLAAVRMVLQSLLDAPGTLRTHPSSLALGAATIWIMNGCYYRPGERFGSDRLSQACCQKALANPDDDAEDPDAEVKPSMYDRGMYFLSDIVVDDPLGYRLPIQCEVDEEVLLLVYNRGSMLDIQSAFGMNVIRNSRRVNPERSNNRRVNPTRPYHYYQDDERGRAQFRAETRGAMLRNPLQLQGRDVALRANRQPSDDSDEERENQRSLDSRLSNIWAQLFFDIIECVPNRRRARDGSWCTITKDDRRSVATEDLFKGFELPFEAVQWKRIRGDEWFALFKHFFPKKGQVPSVKRQNFTSCKYYIDYVALLDFLPNQSAKIVYEELYKKFRDLAWLPYAHSDRMWCTSQGSSGNWHHIPGDATGGPQIAINGDVWNNHPITLRNAYAHLREEEEEDA